LLKAEGYPTDRIRKVLPILAGFSHEDLARICGTSRENVTNHLNMQPDRRSQAIQAGIASILEVPREELFDE
jgi:hypothetical protein